MGLYEYDTVYYKVNIPGYNVNILHIALVLPYLLQLVQVVHGKWLQLACVWLPGERLGQAGNKVKLVCGAHC